MEYRAGLRNLGYISSDGLKALRDGLVVGAAAYLLNESSTGVVDSLYTAKALGALTFSADWMVRLVERFRPEIGFRLD